MSSNPLLGEIMPVGFNFAPRGWAFCFGQLLPISSNSALFSLLGTNFGGDGRTTFGLPDLRGRVMRGMGSGPGLQTVGLGEQGGAEHITQTIAQMPSHSHTVTLFGEDAAASAGNPLNNMLASHLAYAPPNASTNKAMSAQSIVCSPVGGGQSMDIRNPYLGINICIAIVGIYPSRS